MALVKWIKIAIDIFENRKIRQMEILPEGDSIILIWFKLICLAGEVNDNGEIYFTREIPYTEEMLATQLNRPLNTIRIALRTFEQFGMIDRTQGGLRLVSWEKYQSTERLEKLREQTKNRVAKHRQKKKLQACNLPVTQCNATETEQESEQEREQEKKQPERKNDHSPLNLPAAAQCIQAYQHWIGNPSASVGQGIVHQLQQQTDPDLICAVIQDASLHNGKSWRYIDAILQRCRQEGIATRQQFLDQKQQDFSKGESYDARTSYDAKTTSMEQPVGTVVL